MKTFQPTWLLEAETLTLTWPDGTAETWPLDALWPNAITDRQLVHNLQLSAEICGIPDPSADTLRTLINLTRGGFCTPAGRMFLGPVQTTNQGFWIFWGPTTDSTVYGTRLTADDWHNRTTTTADIVANAAGRLRATGLTADRRAEAQTLLNATIFRGF